MLPLKMKPFVLWFTRRMEFKLYKNRKKKHFTECPLWYLRDRLRDEQNELNKELEKLHDLTIIECTHAEVNGQLQNVIDECADIANFAYMIAEKCRVLRVEYHRKVMVARRNERKMSRMQS